MKQPWVYMCSPSRSPLPPPTPPAPSRSSQCTRSECYFICSSVHGHLGYFHVLATVSSVAINTEVQVSSQILDFSGYIPRSDIAGSYGSTLSTHTHTHTHRHVRIQQINHKALLYSTLNYIQYLIIIYKEN